MEDKIFGVDFCIHKGTKLFYPSNLIVSCEEKTKAEVKLANEGGGLFVMFYSSSYHIPCLKKLFHCSR